MADLEYCREVSHTHRGRGIIALKNKWEQGVFKTHYLEHESPVEYESLSVEVYPSKNPLDSRLYFPVLMRKKGTQDDFGFYIICIDADLKMSSELLFTSSKNKAFNIPLVCLRENYIAWVCADGELLRFDAKCELESRVKTIGTIKESVNYSDPDRNEYPRLLAMDDNYIVAATYVCLKIWCKKTHELKLERSVPPNSSQLCSFNDGCLVISIISPNKKTSKMVTLDMVENTKITGTVKHKLLIDGEVEGVDCNRNFVVYTYNKAAESKIVVRDRKTFVVKFSHPLHTSFILRRIFDELIILQSYFKMYALNHIKIPKFHKFKQIDSMSSQETLNHPVFRNLCVTSISNKDNTTVDVWDWKRNLHLCRLNHGDVNRKLKIMSLSESKIVAVESETGNFIIFKFN